MVSVAHAFLWRTGNTCATKIFLCREELLLAPSPAAVGDPSQARADVVLDADLAEELGGRGRKEREGWGVNERAGRWVLAGLRAVGPARGDFSG